MTNPNHPDHSQEAALREFTTGIRIDDKPTEIVVKIVPKSYGFHEEIRDKIKEQV